MNFLKRLIQAFDGPIIRRALVEALFLAAAGITSQVASYFGAHPLADPFAAYLFARGLAFSERVIFQAKAEWERKNPLT